MSQIELDICDNAGPAHPSGPWAEFAHLIERPTLTVERVAILNQGATAGRPSVLLASKSSDHSYQVTEITGDMWEAIAGAIRGARARWGVEDRP